MEIPRLIYDLSILQRAANGDSVNEEIHNIGSLESGNFEFVRVNTGILLRANSLLTYEIECSRCLKKENISLKLIFDELFYCASEGGLGSLDLSDSDEKFTFAQDYLVDITDAVRQYGEVTAPMRPLCSEDCQGLCPFCGAFVAEENCDCTLMYNDPRWSALSALKHD
tara:strand:+ start:129 stop:632 length:504 start_codon:yes stop_codon:yes gene_type:complete